MTKLTRKIANSRELDLLQKFYDYFEGRTVATRKELRDAHKIIAGKQASPHFITKNNACKVKKTHNYDFGIFTNFTPAGKTVKSAKGKKTGLSMTKDAIRKRAAAIAKKANALMPSATV